MRAAIVVEDDPVADGARRVLDAVEAVAMNALLFQCPDHALDHAVLLRAARGKELLCQRRSKIGPRGGAKLGHFWFWVFAGRG